jgi:glutaredoxin-dependent peroxiredoxin
MATETSGFPHYATTSDEDGCASNHERSTGGRKGPMALKAGTKAPDARVATRPGEWVRLNDLYGEQPVVLLFFPLAFSSTCMKEMCAVAEDWSSWTDASVKVFGISVDSPYVNGKFAESTNAAFPILSDFNREAGRAFDVIREDLGGLRDVTDRVSFVIDRTGTIVHVWQGEHPGVFPPLDEILAAAKQVA